MKKIVIFLTISMSLSAASVFAADGSSGCGAGWYILKKNSLVSSTLRTTTNGIFFNNTFGMTFGTSNCQQHSIVMKEKEAQYYAESNQEYLQIEMAEGQGEYLQAFARTLGCEDQAIPGFSRMVQKKYSQIIDQSEGSAQKMLENVKSELRQDPQLAVQCSSVMI